MTKTNTNSRKKGPLIKNKKLRKVLHTILVTLGLILIVIISYLLYVFTSFYRQPDNLSLTPFSKSGQVNEETGSVSGPQSIHTDETYSILTYNVGFGAYTPDYSFFMDGGKSSWAESKEVLNQTLDGLAATISGIDPDFVLLQEVDEDGTRSYHVDEVSFFEQNLSYENYVFAQNYDSAFLFYPITEPHGANRSGIVTGTHTGITSALRRSLPIASSVKKILDYDRCYSITRIPVDSSDGNRELVIFNVHMSAYGTDASVREGQFSMLAEDMQKEYLAGNYVICGGDFNHNLRQGGSENAPDWAQPFPREALPTGMTVAFDDENAELNIAHDSCRNADKAYDPASSFTVLADGFLVSDNVDVLKYESKDLGYAYSDHDPVVMEFVLK